MFKGLWNIPFFSISLSQLNLEKYSRNECEKLWKGGRAENGKREGDQQLTHFQSNNTFRDGHYSVSRYIALYQS